jgi:hypothetical protein
MKAVPNASFFVKDTDCRYVLANAFHLSIYDLTREEELVGKVASDFFPDLLARSPSRRDSTTRATSPSASERRPE